ncbi:Quinone oxidoreductase 1 [Grimontia celer]|uniref:Quinone oxidoreductase 1 n=1 Tax=Grimontia celer TaxID=1796497 RepID=A0A128EW44_9GAMM|nr:medium chain dehydrogenase/reductase family protein [Grimontia celer]CZF78236.1 Quinone oxidoreductase 1 [Grimontia celer]
MQNNQRVIINQHGAPKVLETLTETMPTPQANEVRVKVLAAGVGYADIMAQRGGYPLAPKTPFTPGYDFAGIVDEVGEGVTGFKKGDHVTALNPFFGCYSEFLCIDSQYLVKYPKHLSPAEVCSLCLNYLTAYCILFQKADIQPGQTLLVHSGAGGVGSALIQLATAAGARVLSTASKSKHDLVRTLGATPVDYQAEDFVRVVKSQFPKGIDAAFDAFGGSHLNRTCRVVKRGGTIVSYGFSGGKFGGLLPMILGIAQVGFINLMPNGKQVYFCALPQEVRKNVSWYREALTSLINKLEVGELRPIVAEQVPLSEAYRAHELIENRIVSGKVVLVCE